MVAIKKFSEKVRKANATGTNELRLTRQEATELLTEIADVLSDAQISNKKRREAEDRLGVDLIIDGGTFNDK